MDLLKKTVFDEMNKEESSDDESSLDSEDMKVPA